MSLLVPNEPLEEEIIQLTDSQQQLVGRYRIDKVKDQIKKWKSYSEMIIVESVRDDLIKESILEVKSLVSYAKYGGLARDFVYINNELDKVCQSIMIALKDPAIQNIPWATMTADLVTGNWRVFSEFVELYEKDLIVIKHHIEFIVKSVYGLLNSIISIACERIKEIFIDAFDLVKRYSIPTTLVAAGVTLGLVGVFTHTSFCLKIGKAAAICSGVGIGVAATLIVQKGISMFQETKREGAEEKLSIERVGLRYTRDCIQDLVDTIEDHKYWEEDQGRATKPYRDCEREIITYKKIIDNCIKLVG